MSVQMSGLVWLIPFTPPAKKMVALCIADASNENGLSWPSIATIATRCCIARNSVKRYIGELEAEKWLKREPRFRQDGSQSSNHLRFAVAKLDAEAKRYRKEMVKMAVEDDEQQGGGTSEPGGASPMEQGEAHQLARGGPVNGPGGGPPVGHLEPSLEPPLEPSGRKEERTSALSSPSISVVKGDVKSRRNGRSAQASPEARAIIQAFAEVYRARFRVAYMPNPMEDVTAATFFVDAGLTAEQVAATFEAASRSKGFWASKATTLPVLFRRWAAIQAELAGPAKAQPAGRPGPQPDGRPETDGEAWAREVMEEQPQ